MVAARTNPQDLRAGPPGGRSDRWGVAMSPTVIRVREPRELLAYVPHRLGFTPTESLVAMSVRARPARLGVLVRADLAEIGEEAGKGDVASVIAGHLVADGAARVFAVLYTAGDRSTARRGLCPAGRAIARLRAALPASVEVEPWIVGPSGYAGLDCEDEGCCPAAGRSLEDLTSTQVSAQMVLEGSVVAPSRDSLAVANRAPAAARRAAARGAAAERMRRPSGPGTADDPVSGEWNARGLANWAELRRLAEAGADLVPSRLGRLVAALEDVGLRDELILQAARAAVPSVHSGAGFADLFGTGGPVPARGPLRPAETVLEAAIEHAPLDRGAPALAVLAGLAWWVGDGARSRVLTEQCLGVDPDYRLAQLVSQLLDAGLPPSWAGDGRAA